MVALRLIRNLETGPILDLIFRVERIDEHRVLGHLPYNEIPREKLVLIEPNIEVHIDMRDSLLNMRDEAKRMGYIWFF